MAPIILFRDPIKRVVSHFHFAKTLEWTNGLKIRQQNLTQYLNDSDSMMATHDIWVDGQVSLYLSVIGTNPGYPGGGQLTLRRRM